MIEYINKDITTIESGIIGHGVNCQGVMGSGVALAIKTKWPKVYFDYLEYYEYLVKSALVSQEAAGIESPQFNSSSLLGFVHTVCINNNLFVCNCFTQDLYGRDNSKYASTDAIKECIGYMNAFRNRKLPDEKIYIPKIGAGLGGLDWETEVAPMIEKTNIDVTVCVYEN